jgi:DNA uptake protein ComE-like DNA-binding protein
MKRINYWLRNVFGFSQGEINGFRILTLIMVLAVAAPFLFGLIRAGKPSEMAADQRELDSLRAVLGKSSEEKAPAKAGTAGNHPASPAIADFDPNLLTAEQWQALGLQKSIAQRIINYRQKGGKFRTKADLQKIYGFPADVYARLSAHILLPDSLTYALKQKEPVTSVSVEEKNAVSSPVKTEKAIAKFDLNIADSTQLIQLKGIGPALSRRIINYRQKLGGFASESQLREVYGLDSVLAEEVLKYGFVRENPPIQKLYVNSATAQELMAHPYISPKVANIIVDYRKQHGSYTSLGSLYQIRALNKSTLDKVAPYLSFE